MRILRAADYRVMPWKNGGGTTTEIAVSPDGAGLDDFDWRVSMARIEQDGPFSSFPGIDRTLSILEGEGIILHVADRVPIGLTSASEPLPFPADVATGARLIAGPITDLNVMTRRSRVSHSVERLAVADVVEFAAEADAMLVLCHQGQVRIGGLDEKALGPLDTLIVDASLPSIRLTSDAPASIFVVRIRVAGRNH
jgi:environmental stress-induced protein Ves